MRLGDHVRRVRLLGSLRRSPLFAALVVCTTAFPAVPIRVDAAQIGGILPDLALRARRLPQRLRGGAGVLGGNVLERKEPNGQGSVPEFGKAPCATLASLRGGGGPLPRAQKAGLNAVQEMLLQAGMAFMDPEAHARTVPLPSV